MAAGVTASRDSRDRISNDDTQGTRRTYRNHRWLTLAGIETLKTPYT